MSSSPALVKAGAPEQGTAGVGRARTFRRPRTSLTMVLIAPFLTLYLLLVLLPTAGLLVKSFTTDNRLEMELLRPDILFSTVFSLDQYVIFATNPYNQRMVLTTLYISLVTVIVSIAAAVPIAYLITRPGSSTGRLVRWLVSVPFYVPSVVAAYALLVFFGPYGVFNALLDALFHIRMQVVFTVPAVIAGTCYITMPVVIRTVASAFEAINPDLAEASYSLGGTQFHTFWLILMPLAMPAILAAIIVAFTIAIGLVVIALIVGGGVINTPYLPVEILVRSTTTGWDIPFASAMSVVLLVLSLLGQLLAMLLLGGRKEWL